MNVGEIRRAIEGLPDEAEVHVEIGHDARLTDIHDMQDIDVGPDRVYAADNSLVVAVALSYLDDDLDDDDLADLEDDEEDDPA